MRNMILAFSIIVVLGLIVYTLQSRNNGLENRIKELNEINETLQEKNDSIFVVVEAKKRVIENRNEMITQMRSENDSLENKLNITYIYYEKQLDKINSYSDVEHIEYFNSWTR